MRTGAGSILTCAAAAALVGCSYLVDTRGLTEDPAASADAGGSDAASASDAALDAGGPPPATEAGVDGGAGLDCKALAADPTVVLCDTFDRTDPVTGWSGSDVTGSGVVSIQAVDGNPAFRVALTASNGESKASLGKALIPTPQKRIGISARLRWNAYPSVGAQTMVIQLGAYPNSIVVALFLTANGLFVFEQSFSGNGGFKLYTLASSPAPATWVDAELAVAFGAPATITLALDGKNVLTQPSQLGITPNAPSANIGMFYAMPTPALEILTDDVVIRAE